jgi:hypothetical protein
MSNIDIRDMQIEIAERISEYGKEIDNIGFVCGQNTEGGVRAVWAKVGYRQRIESLEKTKISLQSIEVAILNSEYSHLLWECAKRVRRAAAQIYGKGTRPTYKDRGVEEILEKMFIGRDL